MPGRTDIEWATDVWNPVTGCTPVSSGCAHCYAESIAKRFWRDRPFGDVQCHEDRLGMPIRRRKPSKIFVNSMSDLFHDAVPPAFVASILEVISTCSRHTFYALTKRPENIGQKISWASLGSVWPSNLWLGVSVEDQRTTDERVPRLLDVPAAKRFLSIEPMLGPVDLSAFFGGPYVGLPGDKVHENYNFGIDWVIVGGETGPRARPCNVDWLRSVIAQCAAAGVDCFLKQLGRRWEVPDDRP